MELQSSHRQDTFADPRTGKFGEIEMDTEKLAVRMAVTPDDVRAAQMLRYRVFYEEMGAHATPEMAEQRRDFDKFDEHCDHLLVLDRSEEDIYKSVIGTYRLIRRPVAKKVGQFYSQDEYDVSKLLEYDGEILELGRSAVHPDFRTRPTMQLLWRGLGAYIHYYKIELMFGCASMSGTDVERLRLPLAYLHHYHLAPPALRARALEERYVNMDTLNEEDINPREAISMMPPILKGYLRLGGFVGDGAVVDESFNSTDVLIIVKTQNVTDKYLDKYLGPHNGTTSFDE